MTQLNQLIVVISDGGLCINTMLLPSHGRLYTQESAQHLPPKSCWLPFSDDRLLPHNAHSHTVVREGAIQVAYTVILYMWSCTETGLDAI